MVHCGKLATFSLIHPESGTRELSYLRICAARFHQAKTNGHPDTNNKLDDAKNQDHNSKSHFGTVWVPMTCDPMTKATCIILRIAYSCQDYTVE